MPSHILLWVVFAVLVGVMLTLDLGVFHRKAHVIKLREALVWSGIWIGLSLLFNLGIYITLGSEPALLFLTAYLIEKSLSIDNIFVFLLIFTYFSVPRVHQHRVLFWGILAALVMRAVFIAAGVTLVQKFEWIIYIFGAFLIYTGYKMAFRKDEEIHPEKNPVLRAFRRFFSVTDQYEGNRFFVIEKRDTYRKSRDEDDDNEGYPFEVLAEMRVIEVRPNTSTCVITAAVKELSIGDTVEMVKGY